MVGNPLPTIKLLQESDIYEEINSLLVPADKLRQSLEEYLAEMTTVEDSVAEIESEEAKSKLR